MAKLALPANTIAQVLGKTRQSVTWRAKREGWPGIVQEFSPNNLNLYLVDGLPEPERTQILEWHQGQQPKGELPIVRSPSNSEMRIRAGLALAGSSYAQVAKRVGCSWATVKRVAQGLAKSPEVEAEFDRIITSAKDRLVA